MDRGQTRAELLLACNPKNEQCELGGCATRLLVITRSNVSRILYIISRSILCIASQVANPRIHECPLKSILRTHPKPGTLLAPYRKQVQLKDYMTFGVGVAAFRPDAITVIICSHGVHTRYLGRVNV